VSSNLGLGFYRELADHPLPALLDAGVRCSLSSDDPLMFGGLLGEYELARGGLGFSDDRLADLARTSLTSSDAPAEAVAEALAGIGSWLSAAQR
jgi:adenosine deaminase